MTNANTSLTYSDKSRHLSLVTGNLTTSLRPAYWTFVQSPADRVLPCSESRADPLRGRTLTMTRCSAADSVGMRALLRARQALTGPPPAFPKPELEASRARPLPFGAIEPGGIEGTR